MASNRLEILVGGDAREWANTVAEVNKTTKEMVGNLVAETQKATLALGSMSAAGGALIAAFVDKAAQMEGFATTLTRVMGSAQTGQEELARLTKFAAETPFELPGVVQAGISLRALGVDAETFLPLAGDLASVFQKDIKEGALALGKALAGSQDGIQQLADTYGISRRQMAEFGATMKADGSIAAQSAGDLEKLQGALKAIVSSKYGGAMEAQAQTLNGVLSNLRDSIGQLGAEMGTSLLPTFKEGAKFIAGTVNAVKNLDPGFKSLAANGILAGTAFTGLVAGAAAFQLAIVPAVTWIGNYMAASKAAAVADATSAVAAHAKSVAMVTETEATVLAAAALAEEAKANVAAAGTKAENILAAEGLVIAETELAAATEAASAAQAQYASTMAAAGAAATRNAAATGSLTARMAAFATSGLGAVSILAVLAGAGLMALTAHQESLNASAEKLLSAQLKQADAFRQQRDVAIAAGDAMRDFGGASEEAVDRVVVSIKKLGKNENDVSVVITSLLQDRAKLQDEITEAEARGEKASGLQARLERINELLKLQRLVRHEMVGTAAAQEEQVKAVKRQQAAVEKMLQSYKDNASHQIFASAKEELAALDAVLKAIGAKHKAYADLALDRIKLERQVVEEAKKATEQAAKDAEEARKKEVEAELHQLELLVAGDGATIAKRIELLKGFLGDTRFNTEERRRLEIQLARETLDLTKTTVEEAKKAAETKRKAEEEASKTKVRLLEAEKKGVEAQLTVLQEQFRQGELVLPQLEEQIAKRDQLAASIEKEKAAQEGLGKSAATAASLSKAAAVEAEAIAKTSQLERDKLRETQSKRDADAAAEKRKLASEQAKLEEADLKARFDLDNRYGAELQRKQKERFEAEQQAMLAEAQRTSIGASAEEKTRIRRDLELDLRKLAEAQTKEARALTDEIEKQKKLKDGQKAGFTLGGMSGIEGAGDFSAFDVKRPEKAGDKKKLADLLADQQKAKTQAKEAVTVFDGGYPGLEPKPQPQPQPEPAQGGEVIGLAQGIQAMLERVANTLDRISKEKVEVEVRGADRFTGKDWRTETSKTGE